MIWAVFLFSLTLSLSKRQPVLGKASGWIALVGMLLLSLVLQFNSFVGPVVDVPFYEKALQAFAANPLSFYANWSGVFRGWDYPPLQLYLSSLPYLLSLSAFAALQVVVVGANLAAGVLLYILLGRGTKGLIACGLLLFHPFYIHYSLIDLKGEVLISPFLFITVLALRHRKVRGAGLALASLVKQEAFFPVSVLLLRDVIRTKRAAIAVLSTFAVTILLASLAWLLVTPRIYILTILGTAFNIQSNYASSPQPAFSTFWSVLPRLSALTGVNLSGLQVLSTPLALALFALVCYKAAVQPRADQFLLILLSYIPFILLPQAGPYYLIVFIPFAVASYMSVGLSSFQRFSLLFLIVSTLPYRLADYYSTTLNVVPPYYIGDVLLGLSSIISFFALLDIRGIRSPQRVPSKVQTH